MQKNIVMGVNAAMAAENSSEEKITVSAHLREAFNAMKSDIEALKRENSLFAAKVEEMRAESEDLKAKINALLSKPAKKSKAKKKATK
tara:strand:- start:10634 stop:10897 length:264 start_codon:yes stop_codon:yes gene_type:complete